MNAAETGLELLGVNIPDAASDGRWIGQSNLARRPAVRRPQGRRVKRSFPNFCLAIEFQPESETYPVAR